MYNSCRLSYIITHSNLFVAIWKYAQMERKKKWQTVDKNKKKIITNNCYCNWYAIAVTKLSFCKRCNYSNFSMIQRIELLSEQKPFSFVLWLNISIIYCCFRIHVKHAFDWPLLFCCITSRCSIFEKFY